MSRLRQRLKLLPLLVLIGCGGATAAAYAGHWHWLLELFSHFRLQYIAAAILLAVFYTWQRQFLGLGVAVICAGLNIVPIATVIASDLDPPRAKNNETLVLLSANLNDSNSNVGAVLSQVATERPDVVVLQEYTLRWADDLAELQTQYPHHFQLPRDGSFGLALYSRWPLVSAEAIALGRSTPAIVAELATSSGSLMIIGVHLLSPLTAARAAQQTRQFAALTELIANVDIPVAVVGDFNATPWSPTFRHWTRTAGMRKGPYGQQFTYTWPTSLPLLWIPIDTCVVNGGLEILAHRRGSHIGSDHYPFITTLVTNHD